MKKPFFGLISAFLLFTACRHAEGPDVSAIKVDLKTERFEQDFFALDTTKLPESLNPLAQKYPGFLGDFIQHILGVPSPDSTANFVRKFIHDYRPVYDSVKKAFPDLGAQHDQIVDGLKHVKYYFPEYKLPSRFISFIGPMDAIFQASTGSYGDAIVTDGLATGLQLHLGSGFSMYQSVMGQELFPTYISRRFAPEYIGVNLIKNIVDDLFPDNSGDKPLVEQMVEKGKRIYVTGKLMPGIADTLLLGYTGRQLKGCADNEGLIWNHFLTNGLVFNTDPSVIKSYIGDAPNTPEFGDGAPGYIGLFIGWNIVKKYAERHSETSLADLMKMEPKKLFEESGYRPR